MNKILQNTPFKQFRIIQHISSLICIVLSLLPALTNYLPSRLSMLSPLNSYQIIPHYFQKQNRRKWNLLGQKLTQTVSVCPGSNDPSTPSELNGAPEVCTKRNTPSSNALLGLDKSKAHFKVLSLLFTKIVPWKQNTLILMYLTVSKHSTNLVTCSAHVYQSAPLIFLLCVFYQHGMNFLQVEAWMKSVLWKIYWHFSLIIK